MMGYQLVLYVLWGAIRDRLLLTVVMAMAVVSAISMFMGSAAVVEQAAFTQVFLASGLRIVGVLGLVLFIVFFIRRSFDTKDVEFMLARPIGRIQYLMSYSLAFSLIAIFLGAVCGLLVYGFAIQSAGMGLVLWTLTIMAEYIVIANMALFIAMVLSSASASAMVCFGFYLLCRMSGQFLGITDSFSNVNALSPYLNALFQVISVFLPRLDLAGQTSWLVYGVESPAQVAFIIAQSIIFSIFLLSASLIDLIRRQF
tara:strand:+ start:3055 stop:3822 length:768 start_codon:yes stop_codon:yes gene_type:complete